MAAPAADGARSPQPEHARPVVVEVRRDGFHWGDAGVGAAAALATVAIAAGVAVHVTDRKEDACPGCSSAASSPSRSRSSARR